MDIESALNFSLSEVGRIAVLCHAFEAESLRLIDHLQGIHIGMILQDSKAC